MSTFEEKNAVYVKACDAFSKKSYSEALELFATLDGWLDSNEKMLECKKRIDNPLFDEERQEKQQKSKDYRVKDSSQKSILITNKRIFTYLGIGIGSVITLCLVIWLVKTHSNKSDDVTPPPSVTSIIVDSPISDQPDITEEQIEYSVEPEPNHPAEETAKDEPVIIPSWTPAPESTQLPSEGVSTAGTWVTAVSYYSDGRIMGLTEQIGQTLVNWNYEYDYGGRFLYRTYNAGDAPSTLSSGVMPGTDVNYSMLYSPICNCVGFTIEYEVTTVRKGDGLGDRYLYIYDGEAWLLAGTFSYDSYGKTSAEIKLNEPTTIVNFTTPRIHADDSSFAIDQRLVNVRVADYSYVSIDLEADTISSLTQEPPIQIAQAPGPDDLVGQDGVTYPSNWLPEYETMYIKGTSSGNAYLRWSPSNEGREYNRYVREGEQVVVLAHENGYSLVKTIDGRAGWVTSKFLVYSNP